MTYVKTYLRTLKTHVVNLKRDAKDLSRDLQRLEVRGKLGSKTHYYASLLHLDFYRPPALLILPLVDCNENGRKPIGLD